MKDNNNLCDYNVWSATEYNHDTTNIYNNNPNNIIINQSNDFSNIGESSLKITTKNIPSWVNIDLFKITNPNKTITGKFIIYTPECDVMINLFHPTTAQHIAYVNVPMNDKPVEISVTGDTSIYSGGNISIRVFPRTENKSFYIDNISLS